MYFQRVKPYTLEDAVRDGRRYHARRAFLRELVHVAARAVPMAVLVAVVLVAMFEAAGKSWVVQHLSELIP